MIFGATWSILAAILDPFDLWAPMGPIFEILGGFDRGPIFDEFLSGTKNENLEK